MFKLWCIIGFFNRSYYLLRFCPNRKEMLLKIGQWLCNDILTVDVFDLQVVKQREQKHPQLKVKQWKYEQLFFRPLSSENFKKKITDKRLKVFWYWQYCAQEMCEPEQIWPRCADNKFARFSFNSEIQVNCGNERC